MSDLRQLLPRSYYAFFSRFPEPRPAQLQTIPAVRAGKNVLLISPTGSGKTEAVVAPVAEQALNVADVQFCLYICPTRALVNDVERRIETPLSKLHLRVGVRHADRKTMRGNAIPNILVTTPESLDVMFGSEKDRHRLRTVRAIIIDEAHQFYQTHRGYQLTLLLERLKRLTKAPLQRLLLSATVAQPQKMAEWFQGSDAPLEIIQVKGQREVRVILDHVTTKNGEEFSRGDAVVERVREIVHVHHKVLVFANSRREVDWLYWKLHDKIGVETFLHYSTLDKDYRENVERRFERAQRALCIATSTLELGIDIGNIDAVVMYGAPASIASFVQRIGRGNRRSETSMVYGLCRDYQIDGSKIGMAEDLILFYALVACMLDAELEARPDTELFSVYVQQFFSLASRYQDDHITVDLLERIVRSAEKSPFISEIDLANILSNLASLEFFTCDPRTGAYYPAEKWEQLKRGLQIWGNIARKFYDTVVDDERAVPISQISKGNATPGKVFLIAGEPRMVTDVSGSVVKTMRLAVNDPQLVKYETMGAPTPPEVMEKARELLCAPSFPRLPQVEIDDELINAMRSYRRRFRGFDFESFVPFEIVNKRWCYYTFGGTWANEILEMTLRDVGFQVEADAWRIYIDQAIASFSILPTEIARLRELVRANLRALIHRMEFSTHFHQLPLDLQEREVCSILDLPRLAQWLASFSKKHPQQIEQ